MRYALALLSFFLGTAAALAQAPSLSLPIDCTFEEICIVQQYPDTDPGPEARDYRCGPLSYEGHGGTDIRARTWRQMEAGIPVLAAAPGVVRALRDGMEDIPLYRIGRDAIEGRNAGNVVILRHGDGWETAYAHMRKGSLRVREGEHVQRGQVLGLMGLSGETEFPHLHFSLRRDGREIDPFTGRPLGQGCGHSQAGGYWTEEAAQSLSYRGGGPLDGGFYDRQVESLEAAEGDLSDFAAERESSALVFWALSWGIRAGDEESIRFTGPSGQVLAEAREILPETKIRWLRFVGRRKPPGGWPAGVYRGEYEIRREGALLFRMERTTSIE